MRMKPKLLTSTSPGCYATGRSIFGTALRRCWPLRWTRKSAGKFWIPNCGWLLGNMPTASSVKNPSQKQIGETLRKCANMRTLTRTEQIVREAMRAGARPAPEMPVSEWADRYRILSMRYAAEPGPYRTSRTPYLKEVMDALSPSSPYERVVLMAGAQIGKTEAGNNWIGHVMRRARGPTIRATPPSQLPKLNSKQRIDPMIEASPVLRKLVRERRSRDSGNTVLSKEFTNGGILVMTGAESAVGLRSMPVRYLF